MKRLFLVFLCICMALSAVACSNQPEGTGTDAPTSQQTGGNEPTNQTDPTQRGEDVSDEYDSYAKVGGESIYVNYKRGRRDDTGASSKVFHGTSTDLTILAYDTDGDFSGGVADVLAWLNDGRMLRDIVMYSDADFHDYDTTYIIDIETKENVKINDYDMQKFTGSVMSTDNRNCYVYGYAFVIEGTPCVLAGFVLSEGQEQSLIDAINVEVDTMVKTVRTKR